MRQNKRETIITIILVLRAGECLKWGTRFYVPRVRGVRVRTPLTPHNVLEGQVVGLQANIDPSFNSGDVTAVENKLNSWSNNWIATRQLSSVKCSVLPRRSGTKAAFVITLEWRKLNHARTIDCPTANKVVHGKNNWETARMIISTKF